MTESLARIMDKQLASLREADNAQVADLLQAMEEFDRAGGGQRAVDLPPTTAKYIEPLFDAPQVVPATLSLQPGLRPDLITEDSYVAPLQGLVYTADLPSSAAITDNGRFGKPQVIFTYNPYYPLPGKEEDHAALFLERSAVFRQPGLSGGAINEPLENVVLDKTGLSLFPQVPYPVPGKHRRSGQPTYSQVLHYNHRMAFAVGPQEAQEIVTSLRMATPARGK